MVTQEQINDFHNFACQQLSSGVPLDQAIDELFDLWRFQNLGTFERSENIAAIQQAIDDTQSGDFGRDGKSALKEVRDSMNLPSGD